MKTKDVLAIKFEKRSHKYVAPTHFDKCIASERKLKAALGNGQMNHSSVIGRGGNHISRTRELYREANSGK